MPSQSARAPRLSGAAKRPNNKLIMRDAKELQDRFSYEFRVIDEISPPEPHRFLVQSVKPLQPCPFYPIRCIPNAANMKIKSSTHSHHQLSIDSAHVLSHKPLLLGCAKADP